jgi:hypothetical protein
LRIGYRTGKSRGVTLRESELVPRISTSKVDNANTSWLRFITASEF